MKAISVKCPNCGASLDVAGTAMTVACEYCHTTSKISKRTMFLERQLPPPPTPAHQALPVAVQRHSTGWFVGLTLIPLVLITGVVGAIAYKKGLIGGGRIIWHQVGPIQTTDANGDGLQDAIGFAMHPFADDQHTTLIAISGKNGSTLWESKSLGEFSRIASARIVTTSSALVLGHDNGQLWGFDKGNGARTWTAQLPEKAKLFCAGSDDEHVAVVLADESRSIVNTVDGSISPAAPAESTCVELGGPYMGRPTPGVQRLENTDAIEAVIDMDVDYVFQRFDSGLSVAFGTRKSGTRVPMVGVYDQTKLEPLWTAEAPSSAPLSADTGAPEGQIGKNHVAVVYEVNDAPRVTVFQLHDGKRLWDVGVPQRWRVTGLAIVDDQVLVSSAGLYSFDLATGAERFRAAITTNAR